MYVIYYPEIRQNWDDSPLQFTIIPVRSTVATDTDQITNCRLSTLLLPSTHKIWKFIASGKLT